MPIEGMERLGVETIKRHGMDQVQRAPIDMIRRLSAAEIPRMAIESVPKVTTRNRHTIDKEEHCIETDIHQNDKKTFPEKTQCPFTAMRLAPIKIVGLLKTKSPFSTIGSSVRRAPKIQGPNSITPPMKEMMSNQEIISNLPLRISKSTPLERVDIPQLDNRSVIRSLSSKLGNVERLAPVPVPELEGKSIIRQLSSQLGRMDVPELGR